MSYICKYVRSAVKHNSARLSCGERDIRVQVGKFPLAFCHTFEGIGLTTLVVPIAILIRIFSPEEGIDETRVMDGDKYMVGAHHKITYQNEISGLCKLKADLKRGSDFSKM